MLLSNLNLLATAPIGVARLRELILTLAVQGKLVPQDPNDEPASELLKKIRAEKDRLIADGKIKRDKPLAEIADEEKPFGLPKGWEWVRLNSLLQKIGAGSTPLGGREVYVSSGVKFLRSQNVWDDGLRLDGVAFIKPETHAKMSGTVVVANDLLFNITGASIGRCAVVPSDFDEANVSQHVTIVRTVFPALNAFLHKVLVSRHVQQAVMDVQVGVSREGLSIAKLGQFLIPLPPLAEQSRIVTRVEELMRLCDALEAKGQLEATQHAQLVSTLLATLTDSETPDQLADNWHRIATHFDLLLDRPEAVDALEQTILQLAVRGLLVPQDPLDEPASELLKKIRTEKDKLIVEGKIKRNKPLPPIAEGERPFALPRGWECARLDELSIVVVDCPHSTAKFVTKGLLCIDTNSFKAGVLLPHKLRYVDEATFAERIARLQPEPGDLVFAREGSVGESLIIPEGVVACLGQRVMLFRFSKNVSNEFIRLVITSRGFLDNLLTLHKGIGAKHVNVGDMRLAIVPLPPLAEQSRIVTRVAQLRRLCADLRQRLTASQSTQAHLAEALVAVPSN
jgi:type I restriction enzyme S subunit